MLNTLKDFLKNYNRRLKGATEKCEECGKEAGYYMNYHIDGDLKNNSATNVLHMCPECYGTYVGRHRGMPMAKITVDSHFTAGHYLPHYDGVCNRVHAHYWKYSVTVRGSIDAETGMVMDYKRLKFLLNEMEDVVDHRMLNDVLPFEPTSENLAVWMWEYLSNNLGLKGLYEIRVYESEKCYTTINSADMLGKV